MRLWGNSGVVAQPRGLRFGVGSGGLDPKPYPARFISYNLSESSPPGPVFRRSSVSNPFQSAGLAEGGGACVTL